MVSLITPVLWLCSLLSFFACLALVVTKRFHGRFSLDAASGIQRLHANPTPRVGGLGIFISLLGADLMLSDSPVGQMLTYMLIAGLPAFLAGFAEDLLKRGGVKERLLATLASALIACWLFDLSLTRVNVPGLDFLLLFAPLSVAFTVLGVAGVSNAINIIDGVNGLASGTVIICATVLAFIAHGAGDAHLVGICLVLIFVSLGFSLLNFPFGKIFLGDGGAYLLGFMLGWIAVLLPTRNPEVSAWSSLLACAYPIIEVLFSVFRRVTRNTPFGESDRLHLHSLIRSRYIQKRWSAFPLVWQNSVTALPLWFYAGFCGAPAIFFPGQPEILFLCFVASALIYWVWYIKLVRFGRDF